MKILLHDLSPDEFSQIFPGGISEIRTIGPKDKVHACVGCRSCWLKMPGECPIHDRAGRLGTELSATDELWIISACTYGCVSPFIKKVVDRMMPYQTPFLEIQDNETRFKNRYSDGFLLKVLFYGCDDTGERKYADEYVKRLGKSLGVSDVITYFCSDDELMALGNEVLL
ncbi:MAG: flavodoxin family protein [Lachnospiraceae bacterium]|nr:flavodoxin family protein [Candidatus Equihabitans merdae]